MKKRRSKMCGQLEAELPELTHCEWEQVKERCKKAGIKKYIPDPEKRNQFYRTLAVNKSVEEIQNTLERIT